MVSPQLVLQLVYGGVAAETHLDGIIENNKLQT